MRLIVIPAHDEADTLSQVLESVRQQRADDILVVDDGSTDNTAGVAVGFLRKLGIKPIVGLSGDSRAAADAVAAEVGVDEMHAGLYPEDKVRKVS